MNKLLKYTLIYLGILLVIFISYIVILNSYIIESKIKEPEIKICDSGNWTNVESMIYSCGENYQVCDYVNENKCQVSQEYILKSTDSGFEIKMGVSDSVTALVQRNKWYGTILFNGEEKTLYLFDLIEIPVKVNNKDLTMWHLITSGVCIIILVLLTFFYLVDIVERRDKEWHL